MQHATAVHQLFVLLQMAPIHDRVLIKPMEEEQKTAGGILLPKGPPKANSDAHFGEVSWGCMPEDVGFVVVSSSGC
jgi:hypothetical protein